MYMIDTFIFVTYPSDTFVVIYMIYYIIYYTGAFNMLHENALKEIK